MNLYKLVEVIFWIMIFLPIHSYVFYPMVIWLISKFFSNTISKDQRFYPDISIIVSVYNEEKVIAKRIENIAKQDYDLDKIELIIGSDCSNDKTNQIVKEFMKRYKWIKFYEFDTRRGKASVINDLAKNAIGDVLIFTDANTEFETRSIKTLVEGFQDRCVGGISGKLKLIESAHSTLSNTKEVEYWDFEVKIKEFEGKAGILIGANGAIFSIRKELFVTLPVDKPITDDLFLTLSVIDRGFKFLYEVKALAYEETAKDFTIEFKRKVRFASTNFETLKHFKDLIFGKRLFISFALWSHKILRWMTPIVIILILALSFYLLDYNSIYKLFFYLQLIIYFFVFIGYILMLNRIKVPFVSMIFYFIYSNIAILLGLFKFLSGSHSGIWKPTER